jgi:RNA polymerase sigma factor (TIGR02999 family)
VSSDSSNRITDLLVDWQKGDAKALNALIPLVYAELRRLARSHLNRERPGHTLQSRALVHEVYLRLVDQGLELRNRVHFFAVSSHLMRQILVDYARRHRAAKRGAGVEPVTLEEAAALLPQAWRFDLLALNAALDELAQVDPRQTQIVEMRFFGGLSTEETAEALGMSESAVKREWATARAWLHRELAQEV